MSQAQSHTLGRSMADGPPQQSIISGIRHILNQDVEKAIHILYDNIAYMVPAEIVEALE